jgi:hypothetical protein
MYNYSFSLYEMDVLLILVAVVGSHTHAQGPTFSAFETPKRPTTARRSLSHDRGTKLHDTDLISVGPDGATTVSITDAHLISTERP